MINKIFESTKILFQLFKYNWYRMFSILLLNFALFKITLLLQDRNKGNNFSKCGKFEKKNHFICKPNKYICLC